LAALFFLDGVKFFSSINSSALRHRLAADDVQANCTAATALLLPQPGATISIAGGHSVHALSEK